MAYSSFFRPLLHYEISAFRDARPQRDPGRIGAMDSADYESRRKSQNREAQRRYRQRQKDRVSQSRSMEMNNGSGTQFNGTGEDWAGSYGVHEAGYPDYMAFEDGTSLIDHAGDSVKTFPSTSHSGGSAESYFDVVQQSSYQPSYAQGQAQAQARAASTSCRSTSSCDSSGSSSRGKSCSSSFKLSKSHAKIYAKVDRMVDELSNVYDFGVEMELMSPDEQLKGSISSIKTQFHRSINRAAKTSSRE
ncbi:hypothetical protein V2A60_000066 [Cordyceps javanica]|uniref:BZIP domain-containing protein n=1 Tax=Cordyceps javanica TaxID=43265 RepID=A0A545V6G7_9HYPO|nr:hypothetical protein IF1G_04550 [Cordyceps javanica]TQW08552.1 bZIP transcription factor domain-containing protein [Cordyceps javanica]